MLDFMKSGWWMLLIAIIYDISPIDFIPDAAFPVVGIMDDLGVTGLAVLMAWQAYRKRREAKELEAGEPAAS